MLPSFIGPSYQLESRPASVQRTVNLVPVPLEPGNERSGWVFRDVPGLVSATSEWEQEPQIEFIGGLSAGSTVRTAPLHQAGDLIVQLRAGRFAPPSATLGFTTPAGGTYEAVPLPTFEPAFWRVEYFVDTLNTFTNVLGPTDGMALVLIFRRAVSIGPVGSASAANAPASVPVFNSSAGGAVRWLAVGRALSAPVWSGSGATQIHDSSFDATGVLMKTMMSNVRQTQSLGLTLSGGSPSVQTAFEFQINQA
jgi:hypothetical protein